MPIDFRYPSHMEEKETPKINMEHKLKAAELVLKYMRHISPLNLSTKQENELAVKCAFEEVNALLDLDNTWLEEVSSKDKSEYYYVKLALEDLTEVNKE